MLQLRRLGEQPQLGLGIRLQHQPMVFTGLICNNVKWIDFVLPALF